jgi:hypothetical protein
VGLPAAPCELLARGHSVVHSIKCDDTRDEDTLRAEFRQFTNPPHPDYEPPFGGTPPGGGCRTGRLVAGAVPPGGLQ